MFYAPFFFFFTHTAQPSFKQLSRPRQHCPEPDSLQGQNQLDKPGPHRRAVPPLKVRQHKGSV